MAVHKLRLNKAQWSFDDRNQLGPSGGFGAVFRGTGNEGEVAIKRLNLTAGAAAHRELKVGSSLAERELEHVVPVLDYGQDSESDRYYIVMPVCQMSLQDEIDGNGALALSECRSVAMDILAGLKEVEDIVHRDLKPGNVLFHEGRWRLADFGIAKFVEDSTSLQTLRGSLTPAYGAPEQWRGEAPSHSTDVYALGCILHTMVNGAPPFGGTAEEVRDAHLTKTPAPLTKAGNRLCALVSQMLRKSEQARPSIDRCISVLSSVDSDGAKSGGHSALAAAANYVASEAATADAALKLHQARDRAREALATEAALELSQIKQRLFTAIAEVSEEASFSDESAMMGSAILGFGKPQLMPFNHNGQPNLPQSK